VEELADGNRLEFRDFGVFEVKHRAARIAQNPKTLEPVPVPERSAIRFKAGRLMKMAMEDPTAFEASFGDRRLSRVAPVPATAEVEVPGTAGRQAEIKPLASAKKKPVQPKSNG
ncbi:MAG: HU family DNA-binding protein, partial [Planctomycetota bacterium]|nr:HU family DNA-binding protein [Planctomycetota bacterium]